MALFNLFKPKWQHSDPKVRLKAVSILPAEERQTLGQIATGDADPEVRQAALARIDDWQWLATTLVPAAVDPAVAQELRERLDLLMVSALLAAPDKEAKRVILAQLGRESLLARVVVEEADPDIRLAAMERISDPGLLAEVVTQNCGKAPALLAVDRIRDESLLRRVALEAASRSARALAQQKVEAIEEERERPARLERERTLLLAQARQLSEAANLALALAEFTALQGRWQEISEAGDPRTQQIEGYGALLLTRQQEESARLLARQAAHREHDLLLERLGQILSEIHALAQGVTGDEEARCTALQEEWLDVLNNRLPGLLTTLGTQLPVDLQARFQEANEAFSRSRTLVAHESVEEANLLQALAAIPSFIDTDDLEKALGSLTEAERTFYGWQPQIVSRQQVTERLGHLLEHHRAALARREEARAEVLQTNWTQRNALLTEMRELLTVDDVMQADKRLKELKEIWRRPVDLPLGVADLQPQFAEISRLFAQKLVAVREQETWQRWQNKNLKGQLIEEAEALDGENDLRLVFKRIKELQASWRATGPAPVKEEKALWSRFHQATDRNFMRCRAYFQALDEEAERNLQEKVKLRDLAIAHQESTAWQKSADYIKELQAQWKKIGPGPKEKEQEVFQGFRAACDHFFERRKVHHLALDQERQANLGQKEALCREAEALAEQPDTGHSLKIQELQAAWKAIGPVPKDQEEAVWHRFRAACDRHFAWLDTLRPENLAQKEALCQEAEHLAAAIAPATNFVQVAKKIVALQRRWKEIGPVPKEVQEELWQRFKGACDAFFAAKASHEKAIDETRPANQASKEALLARVKALSESTITRETVREIMALQEEWVRVGPAGKEAERRLQEEFKTVCDTFFKERREAFQEIDRLHRENLKKRESLCLRLEILAGINPQPAVNLDPKKKGGLTLAEQLKVAFETNFVLSAEDARDKKRRAKDEIEAVKQEWQQLGPVPREHEHAIRKRYTEAMAAAVKLQAPVTTQVG